ncbi:DUF7694 domain-containing protein [Deinococcus alpinitundrae]|uniref:DUF7694 domain-containing protein n=1 Tax=Deinococcus alpinitundrae TaxID=468913 RepID=UPI001379426B|nr:hypothetical protein [Deinococcus alpinitundrae]
MFFNPEATVVQIMPPKSQWVNQHQFCLHLWQRLNQALLPQGLQRTVGARDALPLDELGVGLLQMGLRHTFSLPNLILIRQGLPTR